MAFQTPITIKEAVHNINVKRYLLPAIQREVVWDVEQIQKLFDSLMREYPIGSFLFWSVEKPNLGTYQFYEFVRDYHERDNAHNPKADVKGQSSITGILDGQQRLTSLYLGLLGSYAYKEPRKRWDNPQAFPKRFLYVNLLDHAPEDQNGLLYDFRFLTADEAKKTDENTYWFRAGEILDIENEYEVNQYLIRKKLLALPEDKAIFANKTLFRLWYVVHKDRPINYFLEEDESLDKVLNIFIRVNSAGTPLSYSDLLLSIAAAQWKERDAREEITSFVEQLNGIRDSFRFDKDLILKSCLVLSDFKDIAFKVDNFNKSNMLQIEREWEHISDAIRLAVTLVASFGYGDDTLTAKNAIIPIAYYLLKKGLPSTFDQASKYAEDRKKIKNWLTSSLLKRVFGGQPDNVLRPIREILASENTSFPLDSIKSRFRGTTRSLSFSEDEVDNLLRSRYGEGYTFSSLALLYPSLDLRNKFHIDHIFPRSMFTRTKLLKRGVPEDNIDFYLEQVDRLPNLQLLEGIPNQEKSDTDFKDWLATNNVSKQGRADFMSKNFIPDIDLSLTNFRDFIEKRRELLKQKFSVVLELQAAAVGNA